MSDTIEPGAQFSNISIDKSTSITQPNSEISPSQEGPEHTDALVETLSFNIFSCLKGNREKENPIEDVDPYSLTSQASNTKPKKTKDENPLLKNGGNKINESTDLVNRLKVVKRSPWDDLLNVDDPVFVEQLIDLYDLMQLRKNEIGNDMTQLIFQFGLRQAQQAQSDTSTTLGQLIYVISNGSAKDFDRKNPSDDSNFKKWINEQFQNDVEHSFESIAAIKKRHITTGIHDAEIATRNYVSILLSEVLFSGSGKLNFGIINTLISDYLPDKITPDNYKKNLFHILRAFRDKPLLRKKLAKIEKPKSPNAPANVVIRASLGINSNQAVTNLEARKTVFAALTSHLRQGRDGSCFATPLAIVLLNTQIEQCLDDFSSLIQSNKLTRRVNSSTRDFPFILRMSGGNLDYPLIIDDKCQIKIQQNDTAKIYDAPGIIAAIQAIGIDSPKKAITEVLSAHFKETDEKTLETTVKLFLQILVKHAKNLECNHDIGIGTLFLRACFAFEAQENNPLLQVWENAIAGMAEPDETGMVRSAVIDAVMDTFKKKLKEVIPSSSIQRNFLKKQIRTELSHRIHLQYDPVISSNETTKDQKSSEGAFVLYDKNQSNDSNSWIRIDNPDRFKEFISRTLESTIKALNLNTIETTSTDTKSLNRNMNKICKYGNSNSFLLTCLYHYYHRNKEISDPLKNYEMIKYAPWVTKSGNDFSKVVQVYLEDFMASNSEVYSPKDAKDLLIKIVDLGKKFKGKGNKEFEDSPHQLIPVRIPGVHAFNLMLSHPSMAKAWENDENFSNWLNIYVLLPGKQISETRMEKDPTNNFIEAVVDQIIPEGIKSSATNIMKEIPNGLTIKELRNNIVEKVAKIIPQNHDSNNDLCNQIDMILMDSLPKELKKKVRDSALHFADTNWSDSLHDIHLCFIMNPGTGELEIFAGFDDGQKLFPVNPNQWITEKKWEFFTEMEQGQQH